MSVSFFAASALMLVGAGVAVAASAVVGRDGVLRATRLEIVDEKGCVIAVLGHDSNRREIALRIADPTHPEENAVVLGVLGTKQPDGNGMMTLLELNQVGVDPSNRYCGAKLVASHDGASLHVVVQEREVEHGVTVEACNERATLVAGSGPEDEEPTTALRLRVDQGVPTISSSVGKESSTVQFRVDTPVQPR